MSQDLEKWLQSRNKKISDYTDGRWGEKSVKECVVVDHDLLFSKTSLSVYRTEQSYIDSVVANLNQSDSDLTIEKWQEDLNQRRLCLEKLKKLIVDKCWILEIVEAATSNSTVKVSGRRVKNLIKVLDSIIDEEIFYYKDKMLFSNSRSRLVLFGQNQSLVLTAMNFIIPVLASGNFVKIISEERSAFAMTFFVNLLDEAEFSKNAFTMLIANKLNQDIKINVWMAILFESADINSFVEQLLSSFVYQCLSGASIFVQQSIYEKFNKKLESKLSDFIKIGSRTNEASDLEAPPKVNYNTLQIESADLSDGINIHLFRSSEEAISLVNHFHKISQVSIWGQDSLALEVSRKIRSSLNISLNCFNETLAFNSLDFISKTIEVPKFISSQIEAAMKAQAKWKDATRFNRLRIINNFLAKNNFEFRMEKDDIKIEEVESKSATKLTIAFPNPLGIIVLGLFDSLANKHLEVILNALRIGNAVVIIDYQQKDESNLKNFKNHLEDEGLVKDAIQIISIKEAEKIKGVAKLKKQNEIVGIYIEQTVAVKNPRLLCSLKEVSMLNGEINQLK